MLNCAWRQIKTSEKPIGPRGGFVKSEALLPIWIEAANAVKKIAVNAVIICDEPGDLRMKNQRGRPFCQVRIQRSHVGVYFLPIYYHPHLLLPEIKPALHGKTTLRFNQKNKFLVEFITPQVNKILTVMDLY